MKKTELIGVEPIQDSVELAIRSAYVKYEKLVSLIILGEPESGKTELMKKYYNNNGVHSRACFTAYGIIKDLINRGITPIFEKPYYLGHLVIPDLARIFAYKPNTVDATIHFLDEITEDGLSAQSSYAIGGNELKPFLGLKAGIIAGINTFGFFTSHHKVKSNLFKGGFFSRNVVMSYSVSETMLTKIFEKITEGRYRADKDFIKLIRLKLPEKRIDVHIKRRYAEELSDLSRELAEGYSSALAPYKLKGIRLHKSMVSLAKANALKEGRKEVTSEDVEHIRFLSQWMNLEMKPLKLKYPCYN